MKTGFNSLFGKKSVSIADDGKRLLIIEYVGGRDLLGQNKKTSKSDPYFEAALHSLGNKPIPNEKHRGTVLTNTVTPEWDKKFYFGMS